jgi:hypothetical protein
MSTQTQTKSEVGEKTEVKLLPKHEEVKCLEKKKHYTTDCYGHIIEPTNPYKEDIFPLDH